MCSLSVGAGEKHKTNDGHEKKDKTQNENEMTVNLMITSTHGKLNSEPRKYKWKQMSREELAASHQIQIQNTTDTWAQQNCKGRMEDSMVRSGWMGTERYVLRNLV